MDAIKTVLFLCTANYYRSRFAEEYFNLMATREGCPCGRILPVWR